MLERLIDWEHVYLLGYYGRNKEPYLSTWGGEGESVSVVITNLSGHVPMWDAPVPPGAQLQEVPEGVDGHEYAEKLGGIFAFGWYAAEGFERKSLKPGKDGER